MEPVYVGVLPQLALAYQAIVSGQEGAGGWKANPTLAAHCVRALIVYDRETKTGNGISSFTTGAVREMNAWLAEASDDILVATDLYSGLDVRLREYALTFAVLHEAGLLEERNGVESDAWDALERLFDAATAYAEAIDDPTVFEAVFLAVGTSGLAADAAAATLCRVWLKKLIRVTLGSESPEAFALLGLAAAGPLKALAEATWRDEAPRMGSKWGKMTLEGGLAEVGANVSARLKDLAPGTAALVLEYASPTGPVVQAARDRVIQELSSNTPDAVKAARQLLGTARMVFGLARLGAPRIAAFTESDAKRIRTLVSQDEKQGAARAVVVPVWKYKLFQGFTVLGIGGTAAALLLAFDAAASSYVTAGASILIALVTMLYRPGP